MAELDATDDRLVQAVQELTVALHRYIGAAGRLLGIAPTDVLALSVITKGPLSPGDLGAVLGLTSGTVTGVVDRLERDRLVERRPHPSDRRRSVLAATLDGMLMVRNRDGWLDDVHAAARALPADRRPAVEEFLAAVTARTVEHADLLSAARPLDDHAVGDHRSAARWSPTA